jgi:hypothetical protein
VDKLRTTAIAVWQAKERIVLLLMVGFLCYRVWIVWVGTEDTTWIPPKGPLPDGQVDVALPPPPVAKEPPPPVAELKGRNPFWLFRKSSGSAPTEPAPGAGSAQEAPNIKLLSIVGTGDRVMARIQVDGRSGSYKKDSKVGGYTVVSIDADAKQVNLIDDTGRSLTLSPQS